MTTYVFPGQGSQSRGMGAQLFEEFPEYVQKANNILGYAIDKLCLEDAENKLNITSYTQPALYVVNALSYLKKLKESQLKPNYVAGHSLGEYNALFAANVFDFETGLKLVQKRGELMSQVTDGGMAAVIGLKSEDVKALIEKNNLTSINIANYNSFTQVVISGSKTVILESESIFSANGATLFMPLKVSGAFHSPYMSNAQQEFANYIRHFTFKAPAIPVIANVTAKPYQENEIASLLTQQITSPVLWTQSIQYLMAQGETIFEEIGQGKVLTGLISRIQRDQ